MRRLLRLRLYESQRDDSTTYVDIRIWEVDSDDDAVWSETRVYEPAEPKCDEGNEHCWESPHDLVGGLKENPGVFGHGGGVIINEVCRHCGCRRRTDTWAQRMDTGEQGLHEVSYEVAE